MRNFSTKRLILQIVALLFSVVPPIIATLTYFPLWRERGSDEYLSGFVLFLLILALIPLFNIIKERLRSPSAHTMWFLIFILFFLLSKIADEMCVIAFVGFIGNLIGALLFRLAKRKIKEERDGIEG